MLISDMLNPTQLVTGSQEKGQVQDLQRLTDQIAAGRGEKVGQEFESIFTSMLLKQMRESLTEGLFGSDQGDVYGGLFDMLMGQHLAKTAPIGVDQMVDKYLQTIESSE